jgi:radical SAM protein with 4Fe4S-binding SPASM domain
MAYPDIITPFTIKRLKSHFLLVNALGRWALLKPAAYHGFLRGTLPEESVQELTEQGIFYDLERLDCVDQHMINSISPYLNGPHLHIIPITTGCNLDCVYCRTSDARTVGPVNPSFNKLTQIVDFSLSGSQRRLFLEFGIGEPLLRPKVLLRLMRYAKRSGQRNGQEIAFKLTTNGTHFDESMIHEFEKLGVQIGISLDGPKPLHDRQRPSRDGHSSYTATSNWIKFLLENNYPKLSASVTVTRWNIVYLSEIIDEYINLGLGSIAFRFVGCQGRATDDIESIRVSNDSIRKYLPKALRRIVELNAQGIRLRETYLSLFCEKIFNDVQPAHTELMSPCGFAVGQLAYASDGTIYGCEECLSATQFPLGHVESDSVISIKYHPIVETVLKHSFLDNLTCTPCSYMPFCGQCPVITYQHANRFLPVKVHSNRCMTTKIYCDFIFNSIITKDPAFLAYCENFGYSWQNFCDLIVKSKR